MPPVPNPRITYAKRPVDYFVPGEHLVYEAEAETIDLENAPLNGGILVKTLYLSVDPYMRNRMRDPKTPSYISTFELGGPGEGDSVVKVLRSESSKYKVGDHLVNWSKWRAYQILPENGSGEIIQNPDGLPWSTFLGAAGATSMTAFYSTHALAKWKKGDTIFVTTAAGAVGSVVVQLAKQAGLKVIGSTGNDEKVEYLKEIGVDIAFNYKKESVWDVLKEHGPIDIYFDNVGGEQLDAAILYAAKKSRFLMCGYASEYNLGPDQEPYGVKMLIMAARLWQKNMIQMVQKEIGIYGFLTFSLIAEYGRQLFVDEFLPLIKDNKIKYKEERINGLENLPEGLAKVLVGTNHGKAVIVVAED